MRSILGALAILGLVLAALLALSIVAFVRRDRLAAVGEEIVWDDFGFRILRFRTAREIGPPGARTAARGRWCIVDLEVANHAQRVGYRPDGHEPVLVDAEGREQRASHEGLAALAAEGAAPAPPLEIPHGASCVTPLVFDAPADASDMRLEIVFGGRIGRTLDHLILGDRSFALR